MAQQERLTPALLMAGTVALTVGLIVACSGANPAGPEGGEASGGGDGKVTAACPGCFPVPVPYPGTGGGSPAPGGGGVVPVPVPGAPGAPVPPSTPPSTPPSGTPTSPSPSTTASASPTVCTLTERTFVVSTPASITGGSGSVSVQASTSDPDYTALSNCRLTAIRRVTTHITTTDVNVTFGGASMRQSLTVANGTLNVDTQTLMDDTYRPSVLTGTELGTACSAASGFSFGNGGTDLTAETTPYDGLFKPTSPTGSFTAAMLDHKATNTFTVSFIGLGADAVVECMEIVVELGSI